MKNMKVKAKLLLSFIIVAVLVAIAGGTGIVGLNTMNSNEDGMYKQSLTSNAATMSWRNIQAQRAACRGAALKQMLGMEYESEFEALTSLNTEFDSLITELENSLTLPENKERLATAKTAYAEYISLRDPFMDAIRANDEATLTEVLKKITPPIESVVTELEVISGSAIQLIGSTNNADSKTAGFLIILLSVLVVISVAVALLFAFYISGLISKPLISMAGAFTQMGLQGDLELSPEAGQYAMECSQRKDEIGDCSKGALSLIQHLLAVDKNLSRVAGGDLTADVKVLSDRDTIGQSLSKMIDSLNNIFDEINASASQVSTGSKQIADGAQALAQGSTEQASAVEQLSASMSEIADKTRQNAGVANEAAELSGAISGSAEKGSVQMEQMMQAVKEINDASGQISKVIKVIDDIAFQTNILALNAAVEAARAGQHGKGFAVVAEEVRSLAAKSAEAARETGGLIENSVEKATLGLTIATETSASLKDIVEGINRSAEIVSQIAKSSEEQSAAIGQINTGIDQVAQVVQQNSATAEESAAASEEMSGQSVMLEQLISQFKLKEISLPPVSQPPFAFRVLPGKTDRAGGDTGGLFGKY